ncbi:MAG: site-specific DNA-methyltransferase [Victivallales bacterium]|nr:site-specific DNA-methyltransferase [Victivallales bacterium]
MDKRALAQKIKALDGLSNDEKSALLELLHERKKYGIVWEDKPEDVETQLKDELPVLTEVKERAILSDDADAPNHILIEGDNLHALTALFYTHAGKIDVIYIDPPYNTGNNDFSYNDSYVDKEDSYRHSKWLSFMRKRLEIAKLLLSEKGVIFISIDDNEQAQLKLLCDEVFGERNFVTNFIWQSTAGSNTGTDIITVTEYVVLYCKNRNYVLFDGYEILEENFPYSDEYEATRGKYTLDKLDRRRVGGHYSETLNFPIECPDGTTRWPGGGSKKSSEGWNYLWSNAKIQWGIVNGFIVFKKGKDGWNIYNKRYSKIDNTGKEINRTTPFRNLITSDLFNTAQGTAEITTIFGVRKFDFPKPSKLIKYLLTTIVRTHQFSTILDFFAGSGTTMQATMQLNADDGGHRQCILVTNNENNICEEVTYVRNQRVIQGYTKPNGEAVEGLHSNNLRYYKTTFVPRVKTMANMRALTAAATDLLCIKNNVYQEIGDFGGVKLHPKVARYFDDGKTRMLVIYVETFVSMFVDLLLDMEVEGKILVYVFSNDNYAYDDDFEEVLEKVELCALPDAIYKAYKNVLPQNKTAEDVEGQNESKAANSSEEDAQ